MGTPKGRLSPYEKARLEKPWPAVRPGGRVKLLPRDQELSVLAQSEDRVAKERARRRRPGQGLGRRLKQIPGMDGHRDERLKKLRSRAAGSPPRLAVGHGGGG